MGDFILSEEQRPVVLLSAGIGITPLLGMLYTIAESSLTREVWWVHSCRNETNYPFLKEVEEIGSHLSTFHSVKIYSQPVEGEQVGIHYDIQGHLDLNVLNNLNFPAGCDYYLCGPTGYLSDTTEALRSLGILDLQIKSEIFENASTSNRANLKPHLPSDNTGSGPLVNFTKSNISFPWNSRFENILEAAEACDVPVFWSCRVGVCHRCESSLLDGKIEYTSPPLDPPGTGRLLICCSIPVTNIELNL